MPLLLLDADRPENDLPTAGSRRACTSATRGMRLGQYALLGIGGVRALHALGDRARRRAPQRGPRRARLPGARARRVAGGGSVDDAFEAVRARTVFTTHTPVPAGNDTYEPELVVESLGTLAEEVQQPDMPRVEMSPSNFAGRKVNTKDCPRWRRIW